ncbi:MAG TPA: TlpA disulfide reductase family protein [Bacteroidia bacterium]|nr:TlpA family protein disulfide reductase [Sphingobacteriales bacterium]HPD65213.1 TlpA disulfide reductase family protein [Bacteroidia bacterium]HRS58592.1 TlpA disulfide reductase family protein [Bacteroidia bacterium]HRU68041.1 TlpA disulfide reductase family protein [Bacteroidia bacterium]
MKITENIKNQVRQYLEKRTRWQVFSDVLFAVLLVLMLIPPARNQMIIGFRKLTMKQPPIASIKPPLDLTNNDLNWEFQTPEGEVINFNDLTEKPVFLNFWSVSCPHCIAELENIENLYSKYKDKVYFIMITHESPVKVKNYLSEKGIDIPFYLTYGDVPEIFDVQFIPTAFIISTDKKIVYKKTGPARWDGDKMFDFFNQLIADAN